MSETSPAYGTPRVAAHSRGAGVLLTCARCGRQRRIDRRLDLVLGALGRFRAAHLNCAPRSAATGALA